MKLVHSADLEQTVGLTEKRVVKRTDSTAKARSYLGECLFANLVGSIRQT